MTKFTLVTLFLFIIYCYSAHSQYCTYCKHEGVPGYNVGGIYHNSIKKEEKQYIYNLIPVTRSGIFIDNFAGGTDGPQYQYDQVYKDMSGNRYMSSDLPNLREINN